nr:MAG TPA: hypothetical protein [Caudoviricetes sp.]
MRNFFSFFLGNLNNIISIFASRSNFFATCFSSSYSGFYFCNFCISYCF